MASKFLFLGYGLLALAACSKGDPDLMPNGQVSAAQAYVGTYTGVWRYTLGSRITRDSAARDSSWAGTCEIRLADSGRSFIVYLDSNVSGMKFQYSDATHGKYVNSVYDLIVSPKSDSLVWGSHIGPKYSGASGYIPWEDTHFYGKR